MKNQICLGLFCVLSILAVNTQAAGTAVTFFQEGFEDTGFTSRGWYDISGGVLSSTEKYTGTKSLECRFLVGGTVCSGGTPKRHLFTPSDSVYLSYWVKYSSNYIGSGRPYHPHEFHFLTDRDSAFIGPAITHLTMYIEQLAGKPRLALQDALNVNTNCILRNDNSFVGCNGNFNTYPFTENRSVASCNGLAGPVDGRDCFRYDATNWYSARFWTANSSSLLNNAWRHVEVYMKMNSISGGIGQTNGVMQYWLDGQLIINHSNVLYRTGANPSMKFNQFMIAPYIGDGSPVNQTMWLDELVVGDQRPGTSADTTPPSTPGTPAAGSITSSSLSLSWTVSSDPESGIANYEVYRCTGTTCTPSSGGTLAGSPATNSFSDTGLSANTAYRYQVRAKNGASAPLFSPYSSIATATTPGAPVFAYSLSNGGSKSIPKGGSVSQTVTATLTSGAAQSVSYAVSGLPAGTTLSFPSCASTCTSTGTLATSSSTPSGSYTVTVTGTPNNVTTSFTLTVNTSQPPLSGLIAAYNFDEGSGTTLTDRSGTGNTGSLSGPAWNTTGRYGGSLTFDGVNDSVSIPDHAVFDVTNIAVSAWVYKTANAPNFAIIVGRQYNDGGNASEDLFTLFYNNSAADEYAFIVRTAAGQTFLRGPSSLGDLNQWVHVTGTYDGSNMRLYKNGAEVASTAKTGAMVSETTRIMIGAGDNAGGVTEWSPGRIDDVRVYNRALSQTEIQSDMNSAVLGN